MKITNRDKNLLLIIFLILVCALYYQFFFTPQNAKLTELKRGYEYSTYEWTSKNSKN